MKNIITALLLLVSTSLHAQPFWIDAEPETMTGSFNTFRENDAFDKAKLLPRVGGFDMMLVDVSPPTVRFRTPEQGWDLLVFYQDEYRTDAYHLDFSGKRRDITWEGKIARLEQLKYYSP